MRDLSRGAQVWMLCLLVIAGCSAGGASSPSVDWENYAPSVRSRIDSLASSRDCSGLQHEFDTADANSDLQRDRTGDGNADLMAYIDGKLRDAGCLTG
jgi:hypothetical protein